MYLQGQHRSASGLLYGCVCIIYNSFQFNIFRGLLNVYLNGSLILGTSLGAPSVCLLICLVQILCDTFYCILFFFVFYCYLFETYYFLMRDRKKVDLYGRVVGRELRCVEGEETNQDNLNEKKMFLIKEEIVIKDSF